MCAAFGKSPEISALFADLAVYRRSLRTQNQWQDKGVAMRLAIMQDHPATGLDDAFARLDNAASRVRADLLVTPEMWLGGYKIGAGSVAALAAQAGAVQARLAAIARRHGMAICAGMARPAGQGGAFNSAVIAGPDGAVIAGYDKLHLYGDVDRAQFQAGRARAPIVDLAGLRVGMAICFDIEFPETARDLALRGADLIVVPTANMAPYDSVCTRILPTRAEENRVFAAYANYCGAEGDFAYCGQSVICGPDGADLARAGQAPALITADLDRAAMARARADIDYLASRRTDLF